MDATAETQELEVRERPVRVPLCAPGRIDGTGPLLGRVRDLSRCGLFLEGARALRPGSEVTVSFALPLRTRTGDCQALIQVHGEVRHRRGGGEAGVGIRFLRLSRENELLIQHFVDSGARLALPADVRPG